MTKRECYKVNKEISDNCFDEKTLKKEGHKTLRKRIYVYIGIAIFVILLNILAWSSNEFCDAYISYVFPIWVNTYGRFTGIFHFSVGEWLIAAGLLLIASAVFFALLLSFFKIKDILLKYLHSAAHSHEINKDSGENKIFYKFCKRFYCFFVWVLLIVCLIMTLNCLILYHASPFSEKYFESEKAEYELVDVLRLRNEIVERCNELSEQMDRDAEGRVAYPGSILADGSASDMQDKAVEAMQNLGRGISLGEQAEKLRAYSGLDGYYPRPKAMYFSDFMCQQHMQGYYFPFSMEANYNDVMYVMNKPFTMCHELAHLRGYIFEDEANFIGYLACVQSDDIYFQYSGYLCAFSYLENDLYKAMSAAPAAFEQAVSQVKPVQVKDQVYSDNIFVEQAEWDRINVEAVIPTETVDKAADAFIDTNLKINGVEDGALSYNRMVRLLMQYYY